MIEIEIPEYGTLSLKHAVFDMNGTLTTAGRLDEETRRLMNRLSELLNITVITADTFGTAAEVFADMPVALHRLQGSAGQQKEQLILQLGPDTSVAVGNGQNDVAMLKCAALGICIIGEEGAAVKAIQAADIVVHSIHHAIELLLHPQRIKATLRL